MNKYAYAIIALLLPAFLSSCSDRSAAGYNTGINITPKPLEMTVNEGGFKLGPNTVFYCPAPESAAIASFFSGKIKASTGYTAGVSEVQPDKDYISLEIKQGLPVNDEGYLMEVDGKGVRIEASTDRGLFYGMQTMLQLLPAEIESPSAVKGVAWTIPAVTIRDEPRFAYRGFMQDICRHFVDKESLKKQLDILAMYKINKFHWHLTDDQGWRIEIKKYPGLTQISSRRMEGEGYEYGPYFYTQEEVKEIVAYAKERFIEVIPEIEMPGHAVAALTAYPEFSCTGGPLQVRNLWGISSDIFCAGNDDTFGFLTDILDEVIPLFESEYFHIGGDEAPKLRWESCPKCQKRIKQLGLRADDEFSAEEKLQSYFVNRLEKHLISRGRKLIGWDETLEGGLAPSATVMSWRGEKGGIKSANMGHDAIMTPNDWLYLDNYQGDRKILPACNRRDITLAKTYSYNPMPEAIEADKKHHIIGVQANSWAEYMYNVDIVQWCVHPRLLALSEVAWTSLENKDYSDFERRMDNQRVRLDMHGINYYVPVPQDRGKPSCNRMLFTDVITIDLETTEPMKIVYTTNGRDPGPKSKEYTVPLTFTANTTFKARSITAGGRMGDIRTIEIVRSDAYKPATATTGQGLEAAYYPGVANTVAELEGRSPEMTEHVETPQKSRFNLRSGRDVAPEDNYSTVITGHINIPEDGIYYFSTACDQLWIDGELFISNEGMVKRFPLTDRPIALAKGTHNIKMVRLSGVVGGWHPQWQAMYISVREDNEPGFRTLEAEDYI